MYVIRLLLVLAVALGCLACGDTAKGTAGLGAPCTSDDDCGGSLECLPYAEVTPTACTEVGKSCSILCTSPADCAAYGDRVMCFALCDSRMACGRY